MTPRPRAVAAIALSVAVVVTGARASADPSAPPTGDAAASAKGDDAREASRAAFRRGVARAQDGDYRGARDAFLEAYRLFPHPSILLNLGIARWRTGEVVDAEQDLVRFLSDDGGASDAEIASARAALAGAREHLGTLRLRVEPPGARARLDDRPLALAPGAFIDVRAAAGEHALVVEADGFAPSSRRVRVAARGVTPIDVALAPIDAGGVAPAARAPGEGASTRVVVGWTLVGVGAASAAVGAICGVRALSLASDYDTPGSSGYQDRGTRSRGIALRTAADVAFGGAIVAAGVGAYLLLVAPSPSVAAARLVVGPAFAGVGGSF